MNAPRTVERDERTMAVADAGLARAFFFLWVAIGVDVAYRGLVRHEPASDLLALVVVSPWIALAYQACKKALVPGFWKKVLLIALVWGIIGAIFGLVLSVIRSS